MIIPFIYSVNVEHWLALKKLVSNKDSILKQSSETGWLCVITAFRSSLAVQVHQIESIKQLQDAGM